MSTHCLTTVYIGGIKSKPIVCLHRRHDGDREQHGKKLQDFLNAEIADGFTTDMERLAADVVGGNGFAYLGSDITLLVPNAVRVFWMAASNSHRSSGRSCRPACRWYGN